MARAQVGLGIKCNQKRGKSTTAIGKVYYFWFLLPFQRQLHSSHRPASSTWWRTWLVLCLVRRHLLLHTRLCGFVQLGWGLGSLWSLVGSSSFHQAPWLQASPLYFFVYKVKVKSLSRVRLFAIPWTVVYQASLSMGFSRQEYWSGLPFPSPGDLPDPGIKPRSPALQGDALPSEPPGIYIYTHTHIFNWIILFLKLCIYTCFELDFWLCWAFGAACGLSLVAVSRGYSLFVALGLIIAVAALAAEHGP